MDVANTGGIYRNLPAEPLAAALKKSLSDMQAVQEDDSLNSSEKNRCLNDLFSNATADVVSSGSASGIEMMRVASSISAPLAWKHLSHLGMKTALETVLSGTPSSPCLAVLGYYRNMEAKNLEPYEMLHVDRAFFGGLSRTAPDPARRAVADTAVKLLDGRFAVHTFKKAKSSALAFFNSDRKGTAREFLLDYSAGILKELNYSDGFARNNTRNTSSVLFESLMKHAEGDNEWVLLRTACFMHPGEMVKAVEAVRNGGGDAVAVTLDILRDSEESDSAHRELVAGRLMESITMAPGFDYRAKKMALLGNMAGGDWAFKSAEIIMSGRHEIPPDLINSAVSSSGQSVDPAGFADTQSAILKYAESSEPAVSLLARTADRATVYRDLQADGKVMDVALNVIGKRGVEDSPMDLLSDFVRGVAGQEIPRELADQTAREAISAFLTLELPSESAGAFILMDRTAGMADLLNVLDRLDENNVVPDGISGAGIVEKEDSVIIGGICVPKKRNC